MDRKTKIAALAAGRARLGALVSGAAPAVAKRKGPGQKMRIKLSGLLAFLACFASAGVAQATWNILPQNYLHTGDVLESNTGIRSPDGHTILVMQRNGDLVLYHRDSYGLKKLWDTGTLNQAPRNTLCSDGTADCFHNFAWLPSTTMGTDANDLIGDLTIEIQNEPWGTFWGGIWSAPVAPANLNIGDTLYVSNGDDLSIAGPQGQVWATNTDYHQSKWAVSPDANNALPDTTVFLQSLDWWTNTTVGTDWLQPHCDVAPPSSILWSCGKETHGTYNHTVNGVWTHTDWYHQAIEGPVTIPGTVVGAHVCEYFAINRHKPPYKDVALGDPSTDFSANLKPTWQDCG